jgi:hypothetical protein
MNSANPTASGSAAIDLKSCVAEAVTLSKGVANAITVENTCENRVGEAKGGSAERFKDGDWVDIQDLSDDMRWHV